MEPEHRSAKGRRHAQQIIDGAIRCLARDGYGATSLQRVADESGLGKRAVLYHFKTREQLFDAVGRYLGERLLAQLDDAVSELDEPGDIIVLGFERVWGVITTDRALQVAWLGLLAESITNPSLRETTAYIEGRYREVIGRIIDQAVARGHVLTVRRGSLEMIALAGLQGLAIEFVENGETPQLREAIEDFCAWLTAAADPPGA